MRPAKTFFNIQLSNSRALFYTMEDGQITVAFTKKNALAVKKYLVPDKQFVFVR